MQNIIGQINWIDIFVIILLIRICYIAAELGLFIESFKLLGTLASIYLSLHYYKQLSDFTQNAIGLKDSPAYIFDLFSVIILAILSYLIFAILRKVFSKLVKVETLDNLNRWGALILGVIGGFLFAGLIICIFRSEE
ncbi:MAG: CvpA family protein, partial [Candidatus Omnitrophica bacterium]|nr:CvpA family protein [Candidatus Omnitrophota bacterium]